MTNREINSMTGHQVLELLADTIKWGQNCLMKDQPPTDTAWERSRDPDRPWVMEIGDFEIRLRKP